MTNIKISKSQSNRDELLIENAILKYNERVREMLKQELRPIYVSFENQNTKIEKLNIRVDEVEIDIKEIKETVEPFTKFRRLFWIYFIIAILVISLLNQDIQSLIGKMLGK